MKRRFKFASYYTLTAFGVAMLLFFVYITISDPETLTWYEQLLTYITSAFIADWLCKGDDTNEKEE